MGNRTIFELNHDFIASMDATDWEAIKRMVLNHPDVTYYRQVNGVRVLLQRWYDTPVTIKTPYETAELK